MDDEKPAVLNSSLCTLHSSLHGGGLHFVEQFAAVDDEVEFGGFVAASDAFDELFEHVELVAVCDALRFEVSAVSHAPDEFGQRQAPLERAPAVSVRAAHQILN